MTSRFCYAHNWRPASYCSKIILRIFGNPKDKRKDKREEAKMQGNFLTSVTAVAISATLGVSTIAADKTAPPIGGGYANAIPIPVDDPTTKNIAGALFKPAGAGPFPAVVYIGGCPGLISPSEMTLEGTVIDHLLTRGVATLIVDPFTPRNEKQGICPTMANLNDKTDAQIQYVTRGGNDALAAVKVLKTMPEIDPNHIFLLGYSYGAISSLFATDAKTPGARDARIAGVIAFYPYCYDNIVPVSPTLVLAGDKDDWTPVGMCQAVKSEAGFEVVVYPGVFHAFASPRGQPIDFLGHHIVFDVKAALDAQQRADAFIDAHIK
jgi:dienelactone hydrolase